MSSKQFQTNIVIGGKASPSLNKAFQAAQSNADKTSKAMRGVGSVIAKVGAAVGTYMAVGKVIDFGSESVAAYNDSAEAATKLTTVMKQRMHASAQQISQISSLTAAQQKLGVVEDDTQTAGTQQLATFLNSSSSLKTLIPAMNNLAVQQNGVNVTSENMVNIGNLMGKVMQGQTGALSRVGITFSKAQGEVLKYGTESQKAAVLAQVITDNVGEMNKAIAATPKGVMQQLKNTWGDIQETVGQSLMQVAVKLAPTIQKIIPIISKLADFVAPLIAQIGDKLVPIVDNLFNKYLVPNLPMIMKAISGILGIAGQLYTSVIAPILPVIMDVFAALMPLISSLVPILMPLVNLLMQLLMPILNSIAPLIQNLTPVIQFLANIIVSNLMNNLSLLMPLVQSIMGVFNNLIAFIKNVFTGNWSAAWENVKNIFGNLFSGLVSLVKLPFNVIIKAVNSVISSVNKVKIPSWIPFVGGKSISIPQIPMFASGATVSKATLGIFGEAGPETIVPHNNKPRSRALLSEAAAGVGIPLGGNTYIQFSPVIQGGGTDIRQQVSQAGDEFERRMEKYFSNKGRLSYA